MELTITQIKIIEGKLCPYCKKESVLIDSAVIYRRSYGMIYFCETCGAYVGVHKGTDKALGRLANKELRGLKKQAHYYFDQLWDGNNRSMSRDSAYKWLSMKLGLPPKYTHIGMFGEENCRNVINYSKEYLTTKPKKK